MAFATIAFADPIGPNLPSPNDCKGYGETDDTCSGGIYNRNCRGLGVDQGFQLYGWF